MSTPSSRLFRTALLIALGAGVLSPAMAQDAGGAASATISARPLSVPTPAADLAESVKIYRQHIFTLANPFMEGREPSTKGNRIAADYVQFHLSNLGLRPAFTDEQSGGSSWRQPFSVRGDGRKVLASQALSWGDTTLEGGKDFSTLGYSASSSAQGPLVFVGYSIRSGEGDYASYPEDTDLSGKIAVMFRFEPMNDKGGSKWVEEGWTPSASLRPKLTAAITRKAAGIILVSPPGVRDERAAELSGLDTGDVALKVPVMMMTVDAAEKLVRAADPEGRSLMDFRKLADKAGGVIDLPNTTVKMAAKVEREPLMTDNVGAILPGRGALADEFVVVGAHYDHVGYGKFGSMSGSVGELHPGADDNASGTSALLVTARMLADAYGKLPADANCRSVLFLAFSAEESGLIGSAWYANHMLKPVEKHYIMLNMDMVGRLRDGKLEVGGVGTGEGLEQWLDPYWSALDMKVKTTQVGPPNSDHFSFHQKKIPNIFFFTGFHDEYHRPLDTPDLINCEGAVQIADLCARIALDASSRAEPLPFRPGRASRPAPAAQNNDEPARPSRESIKVRFGIKPGDYSGEEKGVAIGDVIEDLPAQKAGLKAGDLMIKWGGVVIEDVGGWMAEMAKNNPGDKVIITFLRDGKEQTTEALLVGKQ